MNSEVESIKLEDQSGFMLLFLKHREKQDFTTLTSCRTENEYYVTMYVILHFSNASVGFI